MDEVDDMQDVEEEQNGRPKQMQIENSNTQAKEIPDFKVLFRNYAPRDPSLALYKEDQSRTDIAKQIEENLKKIAQEEPDWNNMNLAPKKINWDLKRDVIKKQEKLEVRTQRAIVEMLKDKLNQKSKISSSSDDNLAKGVSIRMARDFPQDDDVD